MRLHTSLMTNHEIWQAVLGEIELTISKANFNAWFQGTGIASYDNGKIVVCVPSSFAKGWFEKKYHTNIIKAIERVTGKPVKKLDYTIENIKNIQEQECQLQPAPPQTPDSGTDTTSSPATAPSFPSQPTQQPQSFQPTTGNEPYRREPVQNIFGLNPKYTFSTFIVGKGNELAHAAAQAVANRPGEAYNPLFIYGGVGLGKTHLIQAIGNDMLEKNANTKIMYVNSEKFTNDFISSVKEGRAKEFKDRYRNVDLLLIDDIQFIGGKEQTQEEFFHTFNELHQQGKQIVLTSDRPPKAIPGLEDRLRSRLEWGMIVDIAAPDLETRIAIVQAKCQEKRFPVDEKTANLIAVSIQNNIRELEGVLNKIIAFHQLKNTPATAESIKAVLVTLETQPFKKSATPKDIINEVGKFYDITLDDIAGKSREKRLAHPRQIIMYLLRTELKMSYPAIGEELGGRDHTTAMHAHTKISTDLDNDPKLKGEIDSIKQRLYSHGV